MSRAHALNSLLAPPDATVPVSRVFKLLLTPALALALPVAYVAGAVNPPQLALMFSPRYSPPPPDRESKVGKEITAEVERELQELAIVNEMRTHKDWYESREYALA